MCRNDKKKKKACTSAAFSSFQVNCCFQNHYHDRSYCEWFQYPFHADTAATVSSIYMKNCQFQLQSSDLKLLTELLLNVQRLSHCLYCPVILLALFYGKLQPLKRTKQLLHNMPAYKPWSQLQRAFSAHMGWLGLNQFDFARQLNPAFI